jgi:hypothetical protein
MTKPTLVVMAAGMGSRYGGLKQIDPVGPNGELIIDYSIFDALKAGFGKVIFITREEIKEALRERVGKNIEDLCETAYVIQRLDDVPAGFAVPDTREKPWGTAHAILSCKEVVSSPFGVINADDFYGRASYQLLCSYLKNAQDRGGVHDCSMIGYVLENTLTEHGHVARGVCTVENGYLKQIDERTRIERFGDAVKYTENGDDWTTVPKESTVSMNMWGFTPGIFPEIEARFNRFLGENGEDPTAEYLLPDLVGELIKEDKARVKVLMTNERWFGVTYQEDMPEVRQGIRDLVNRGAYPENLWRDN